MGADVVKLVGSDIAAAILRFARDRGATLIIVGQSRRSRWHRLRYGSVVDRLIYDAAGLDVLVVAVSDSGEPS